MPEGELFPSERGGKILSFGGYLYNRHSESKDGMRTYWMWRRRPQCKTPRYPPKAWNQYLAARANMARTNNATEGWHNRFDVRVQWRTKLLAHLVFSKCFYRLRVCTIVPYIS